MKTCKTCNEPNPDTAFDCKSCGAPLAKTHTEYTEQIERPHTVELPPPDRKLKVCKRCGAANEITIVICRECGESLHGCETVDEQTLLAETIERVEKKSRRTEFFYKILRYFSIGLFILLLVLGIFLVKTPELFFSGILLVAIGTINLIFPDLAFQLRNLCYTSSYELTDFYYTMNLFGAAVSVIVGLGAMVMAMV